MNVKDFGDKLRFYRKKNEFTQEELAKILNLSQVTIANYERGLRFPRPGTLKKLTGILQISLDTLLDASPENTIILRREGYNLEGLMTHLLSDSLRGASEYVSGWKKSKEYSSGDSYNEIFVPLLRLIGKEWFKGDLLISEEHLMANKVRELILLTGIRESERNEHQIKEEKRWMGLCAPGEEHELALLMNAQLMRSAGWKTFYLGTNIPFPDLRQMVEKYDPKILTITATMNENLEGLGAYINAIREVFGDTLGIITAGKAVEREEASILKIADAVAISILEGRTLAESILDSKGEKA